MSKNEKLGLDDVYICAFHNSMTSKRKIIAFNTSDGLIDFVQYMEEHYYNFVIDYINCSSIYPDSYEACRDMSRTLEEGK